MFEHYTEKARQAVFLARTEAGRFGSQSIETEHLLLGFLEADKATAQRFLGTSGSESIRRHLESRFSRGRAVIPTTAELQLSHESQRVLAYAAEEAERLKHKHIGAEHLLLGLLREGNSPAAEVLRVQGIRIERVRETLATGVGASPERLRNTVAACLGAQQGECGVTVLIAPEVGSRVPDLAVYVGEPDPDVPPLICIEALHPDERFGELIEGLDDYIALGVRYVWVLDPAARRAYVATAESGLHEFKGSVLRTDSPGIELPLAQVFS